MFLDRREKDKPALVVLTQKIVPAIPQDVVAKIRKILYNKRVRIAMRTLFVTKRSISRRREERERISGNGHELCRLF